MSDYTKYCTRCFIRKPLDSFYKEYGTKDNRKSHCIDCHKNYKVKKNKQYQLDKEKTYIGWMNGDSDIYV